MNGERKNNVTEIVVVVGAGLVPARHSDQSRNPDQLNSIPLRAARRRAATRRAATRAAPTAILIFAFCLLTFRSTSAFATAAGTTTGELLSIPTGTRADGMGGAYTALADDSSALEWNPAGLSFANQKEASFAQTSLIDSVNYEHLAFSAPGESYSFGTSLSYLGYGSIAGYDNNGVSIGNQSADALDFSGGVATMFKDSLSLGMTGSFLRESLADVSANTFAVNGGAIYAIPFHPLNTNYRVGASVLNLGPGLKFVSERDPLPEQAKFGVAAMGVEQWPLTLTMDLGIPNDNVPYVSFGSEYWFREVVALRLGYSGSNDEEKGLRVGVGIKLRGLLFDYSYGSAGDFGAVQRFSLSFRFGEKIKQLNREERAVLKEAKAARDNGDYVQAIMSMEEILQKDPDDTHVLKEMISTHEAMLKKELGDAVAQTQQEPIPSPEEFALQDLVPGQQAVAQNQPQNVGDDPLGLRNLPDVTNLDVPSTEDLLAKPVDNTPQEPKAVPTVSQPTSPDSSGGADNGPLINPSDIK